MKSIIIIGGIFLLFAFVYSCEKENDDIGPLPQNCGVSVIKKVKTSGGIPQTNVEIYTRVTNCSDSEAQQFRDFGCNSWSADCTLIVNP